MKSTFIVKIFLFFAIVLTGPLSAEQRQVLQENIAKARVGDFIVTHQGKMFSVLHIRGKTETGLILEEISAPRDRIPKNKYNWREWVEDNAPGHSSWVMYRLNTKSGVIESSFSYTQNSWFKIRESDNFLTALLNIPFYKISLKDRKRVGPKGFHPAGNEMRDVWQPKMVVNGQTIENITFDAWKARWPNDGTELAGKMIEVYIPEENTNYPSYFPYWLQISGIIGKAKIRIVESGGELKSPKPIM